MPIIFGGHLRYGERETWPGLVEQIGRDLKIPLPWAELFDDEGDEAGAYALLQAVPSHELLRFAACLLLSQEAREAIRFGGETPHLDFVLGHTSVQQHELKEEDESEHHLSDSADEEIEIPDEDETCQEDEIADDQFSPEDLPKTGVIPVPAT